MDDAAAAKMLRLVGLGVRGRLAVVGVDRVREAALGGKLIFAIIAPNAGRNSLDKVVPLLRGRKIEFVEGPSAAELGAAVGRVTTAAVGIVDAALARGIRNIVAASGSAGAP